MYRKLQLLIPSILCLALSVNLTAQDQLTTANKQYDLGAYELAIYNYKQILQVKPNEVTAIGNLADAYVKTQNYQEASRTYELLANQDYAEPRHILNYAHLLKSMGLYDQARKWYIQYATYDHKTAKHYAESCEIAAKYLADESLYDVSLYSASSTSSDFGLIHYNGNAIFCSFRNDIERPMNESEQKTTGNDLFVSYNDERSNLTRIGFLRSDIKQNVNIGPLNYQDRMVAYTKNHFANGNKQITGREKNMSIYFGTVTTDLGDWEMDKAFRHNAADAATAFPAFAENGEILYFCSNVAGGYGGFDIYVSRMINGEWSKPVNLGPEVNSAGNEITPYVNGNDLYFSSDHHYGLGEYDVFRYDLSTASLENMGNGVNSPMDDYYFTVFEDVAYFTSNRLGGKGKDDIYVGLPIRMELLAQKKAENTMPAAVDLEALEAAIPDSDDAEFVSNVSQVDMQEMPSKEMLEAKMADAIADNYFSLENARKVDLDIAALPQSEVYFIQLASLSSSNADISRFKQLTNLGNLYKVYKGSTVKIRLGYFYDQVDTNNRLREVRNLGFTDAFIVHEMLNTAELELIKVSDKVAAYDQDFQAAPNSSNFKIRLASYTDPLWFDVGSVMDIGEIEQWTKGEFTIFVLSGYDSLIAAEKALIKAKNRGFKEAHIVEDVNGYLQKVNQN